MAVLNLDSLVLSGSVLRDVLAINVRLGTSVVAGWQTPRSGMSMRYSLPRTRLGRDIPQPPGHPDFADYNREEGVKPGAGRSRSQVGVHHQLSAKAGRAGGGFPSAAVASRTWISGSVRSAVAEVASRRPDTTGLTLSRGQLPTKGKGNPGSKPALRKQAGRTPPVVMLDARKS